MRNCGSSLRRAQHRFSESLALLEQARKLVEHDDRAVGHVLLNKEHVFERMGDLAAALATLKEAAPWIERAGDSRLRFLHRHKIVNNLWHLGRYEEAAALLPEVQELAQTQKAALDSVRVLWLGARIAAGLGQADQAEHTLDLVRREFTGRKLAYDAALVSLDLAILLLEVGRTAEVRELAAGMAWIFREKRIHREVLAALALFCRAAQHEAASAALAREVRAEVHRLGSSASRPKGRPKGRA
jgi:tetratricopeptide (TPR) repeat protein